MNIWNKLYEKKIYYISFFFHLFMKSSQDNVSSDETSSTTTKTQQKLKQNKKPSTSRKQDLQAETPTTRAITEHKKTPSDFSEEVVDDDNELSSEGAQSQVV